MDRRQAGWWLVVLGGTWMMGAPAWAAHKPSSDIDYVRVSSAYTPEEGEFEIYQVTDWVRSADEVVERFDRGRGRKQFLFLHTYEIHDPYFHTTFTEGLPAVVGRGGGRQLNEFADQRHNPKVALRRYPIYHLPGQVRLLL